MKLITKIVLNFFPYLLDPSVIVDLKEEKNIEDLNQFIPSENDSIEDCKKKRKKLRKSVFGRKYKKS
jgi:hypothetical protein